MRWAGLGWAGLGWACVHGCMGGGGECVVRRFSRAFSTSMAMRCAPGLRRSCGRPTSTSATRLTRSSTSCCIASRATTGPGELHKESIASRIPQGRQEANSPIHAPSQPGSQTTQPASQPGQPDSQAEAPKVRHTRIPGCATLTHPNTQP